MKKYTVNGIFAIACSLTIGVHFNSPALFFGIFCGLMIFAVNGATDD